MVPRRSGPRWLFFSGEGGPRPVSWGTSPRLDQTGGRPPDWGTSPDWGDVAQDTGSGSPFSGKKKCQRGRERRGTKNPPKSTKVNLNWVAKNDLELSTTSPDTARRDGSNEQGPGVISGTFFYVIFPRDTSKIWGARNFSGIKGPCQERPSRTPWFKAARPRSGLGSGPGHVQIFGRVSIFRN